MTALRSACRIALALLVFFAMTRVARAGPPFQTDDPDPTPYRNWEIYFAWTYAQDAGDATLETIPLVEFNYGALPNVQVSVSTAYSLLREPPGNPRFVVGDTQLGIKYRFIGETDHRPMVALYPQIIVPGGGGAALTFLPLWLQKTWGKLTVYGGGGFWHDPGSTPHDWSFAGITAIREVSRATLIGIELYHNGEDRADTSRQTGYGVGVIARAGPNGAVLFSFGRAMRGDTALYGYAGYNLNVGPKER